MLSLPSTTPHYPALTRIRLVLIGVVAFVSPAGSSWSPSFFYLQDVPMVGTQAVADGDGETVPPAAGGGGEWREGGLTESRPPRSFGDPDV
jgi:hypothetical protein